MGLSSSVSQTCASKRFQKLFCCQQGCFPDNNLGFQSGTSYFLICILFCWDHWENYWRLQSNPVLSSAGSVWSSVYLFLCCHLYVQHHLTENSSWRAVTLFAHRPSGEKKPADSKAMPDLNGYQIRVWRELCLVCLAPRTSCWPQLGPGSTCSDSDKWNRGVGAKESADFPRCLLVGQSQSWIPWVPEDSPACFWERWPS